MTFTDLPIYMELFNYKSHVATMKCYLCINTPCPATKISTCLLKPNPSWDNHGVRNLHSQCSEKIRHSQKPEVMSRLKCSLKYFRLVIWKLVSVGWSWAPSKEQSAWFDWKRSGRHMSWRKARWWTLCRRDLIFCNATCLVFNAVVALSPNCIWNWKTAEKTQWCPVGTVSLREHEKI